MGKIFYLCDTLIFHIKIFNMNKFFIGFLLLLITSACTDKNITKNGDGSYTVNTTEIGAEIKGFYGNVPLNVTIKGNTIIDVEILANEETPEFLDKVKETLLPQLRNLDFEHLPDVDAVSGATYTSQAVLKNVKLAIEYNK